MHAIVLVQLALSSPNGPDLHTPPTTTSATPEASSLAAAFPPSSALHLDDYRQRPPQRAAAHSHPPRAGLSVGNGIEDTRAHANTLYKIFHLHTYTNATLLHTTPFNL